MKKSYLLLPGDWLEELTKPRDWSASLLAGFQALWHPALLASCEDLPAIADLANPPPTEDALLVVPNMPLESAGKILRDTLSQSARLLVLENTFGAVDGPDRLLESLQLLPMDEELRHDFYALGYAYWGLEYLYKQMGQNNPLDAWSFATETREAAEAALLGDGERARSSLQAAFDLLHGARQNVYPATINWVDLNLFWPQLSIADFERRAKWNAAFNLLLTGSEMQRIADENPQLRERLAAAVSSGTFEVLGGPYDSRPWSLLPPEARAWQLERSAAIYLEHLGREVDGFAARGLALSPETPQLLMKFQFRYALHASFDGSRVPQFRSPKLHWTAPDGSVIEALCRVARDASAANDVFGVLAALAKTLLDDRAATLVLAHWLHQQAPWYYYLLRGHQFAPVFGRFETFSGYFMNSTTPDRPTDTRGDEYASTALTVALANKETNAISRWTNYHGLRSRLEAVNALLTLYHVATGDSVKDLPDLETALENQPENLEQHTQALAEREQWVFAKLAAVTMADAPAGAGYLIYNPCNFPRRLCLELPDINGVIPVETPVRAFQAGKTAAVVVDIPGWGFAWLPQGGTNKTEESKLQPLASGRRLRNEFVEVEIDSATGGIRGVWDARSGHSRLGQQLCHGDNSKMVGKRREITATGPAYGEIVTEGEVMSGDRKRLANFRQTTRVWRGRPNVEITIHLDQITSCSTTNANDYLACRWAWPDEKTGILPANGFSMHGSRTADLEAPWTIEWRERNLVTNLLTHGMPFHRRVGYRMADTLLVVAGETQRTFRLTLTLDYAHPFAAVYDVLWPPLVGKVEHGPPLAGRTGWLASLNAANLLCTRLTPFEEYRPGARLRLVETSGKTTRADLRFCKNPEAARLTNARGELIFDLHPNEDGLPIDFSPHEMLQIESFF